MSYGRHSYVAFYPSDWLGGTARLTRLHRSVYFDICCYNWDTAKPCPKSEAAMMVCDLPNAESIINDLITMGKLVLYDDGSIGSQRALLEAVKSLELWEKKSKGGKSRAKTVIGDNDKTDSRSHAKSGGSSAPIEPEPEPTILLSKDNSGEVEIIDPRKLFFDMAKSYLLSAGVKNPGALVAKWLRDHGKDLTVAAINAAQLEKPIDPVAYIGGYFRRQGVRRDERDDIDAHNARVLC